MKNRIIVCLMFIVSLITVSVMANAEAVDANNENANLVVYRAQDGSSMNYRIWVDGEYYGKLKHQREIKLQLEPGEHVISTNDRERSELVVTVSEQGATYVKGTVARNQLKRVQFQVEQRPADALADL